MDGRGDKLHQDSESLLLALTFSKIQVPQNGWIQLLPDETNSFYSLCMRHLMIPKGADKEDIWMRREIVPSVMRKYQHMKCNLNNDINSLYMSEAILCVLCVLPAYEI